MSCREFETLLDPYLDGELPIPEVLATERHLSECGVCRSRYEGLEWLGQVIEKAKSDNPEQIIEAWEDSTYDGLEGKFLMRKCDHQAVQPGFVVEAVKDPAYTHLIPKILATYPGDKVTPKCRTEDF